jgi:hypothetical protein
MAKKNTAKKTTNKGTQWAKDLPSPYCCDPVVNELMDREFWQAYRWKAKIIHFLNAYAAEMGWTQPQWEGTPYELPAPVVIWRGIREAHVRYELDEHDRLVFTVGCFDYNTRQHHFYQFNGVNEESIPPELFISQEDRETLRRRLILALEPLARKASVAYSGKYQNAAKCHANRRKGAMSSSRQVLSKEGMALEDRMIEWFGEKPHTRGFKQKGIVWWRFIVGPWTEDDKMRRNGQGQFVTIPGKPHNGVKLEDVQVFRDLLLDEGADVTLEHYTPKHANDHNTQFPCVKVIVRG